MPFPFFRTFCCGAPAEFLVWPPSLQAGWRTGDQREGPSGMVPGRKAQVRCTGCFLNTLLQRDQLHDQIRWRQMIISPDKRQSRRVVNYHRHPESDQRAGPSAPQRWLSCRTRRWSWNLRPAGQSRWSSPPWREGEEVSAETVSPRAQDISKK